MTGQIEHVEVITSVQRRRRTEIELLRPRRPYSGSQPLGPQFYAKVAALWGGPDGWSEQGCPEAGFWGHRWRTAGVGRLKTRHRSRRSYSHRSLRSSHPPTHGKPPFRGRFRRRPALSAAAALMVRFAAISKRSTFPFCDWVKCARQLRGLLMHGRPGKSATVNFVLSCYARRVVHL